MDEISNLTKAMTLQLNEKINQCARTLNRGKLLAKLRVGDVVAHELKYHPHCLAGLYNDERAHLNALFNMELTIFTLVRSYREGNFSLFRDTLRTDTIFLCQQQRQ